MIFYLFVNSYFVLVVILFVYISKYSKYTSMINTLCYSWIPTTKYEVKMSLCKLNCSYTRYKHFPSNPPFQCENKYKTFNKNNNVSYKIYLFNTTTYGKYVKDYRFFYGNSNVYYII